MENHKNQKTQKADYVKNQLTLQQKTNLLMLTKHYFPNVQKFTMTAHLNIIVTLKNGDKILFGHWFLFCVKSLLPRIVGSKYSNTYSVLQRVLSGENIVDVLYQHHNNLFVK